MLHKLRRKLALDKKNPCESKLTSVSVPRAKFIVLHRIFVQQQYFNTIIGSPIRKKNMSCGFPFPPKRYMLLTSFLLGEKSMTFPVFMLFMWKVMDFVMEQLYKRFHFDSHLNECFWIEHENPRSQKQLQT